MSTVRTLDRARAEPGGKPAPPARLALVRAGVGNQEMQQHLRGEMLRPKLAVGRADDPAEEEDDRIAERIAQPQAKPCVCGGTCPACHSGGAAIRRQPERGANVSSARAEAIGSHAGRTLEPSLRAYLRVPAKAAHDHGANATLPVQIQTPSQLGEGKPLAEPEKAFFGSRLRHDFSNVRVHSDARAAESARAINAVAYTVGQNIVFNARRYAPQTPEGRRLLAHELAHVVQQSTAPRAEVIQRQPLPPASGSARAVAAAPPFTQSDYDAAVALIASRNARLHSYLRQGRVGSTVRVRTEHLPVAAGGPSDPTAIDFFFDLQITAGGAAGGARAHFALVDAKPVMTAPTATFTQPLPFVVNPAPPGATNAVNQLAEELFHEGLHMLIKMDRVMERYAPGAANLQTGALASFNTYKARARAGSNFLILQVDLSVVIGAYFSAHPGTPGAPTTTREFERIADQVIDRIIEERFAVDQQRQQFTGSIVAGTTNNAIARGYLRPYLADEGVNLAVGDANTTRLLGEVEAMLNDIPVNLGAPSPPPAGSGNPPPSTGSVAPSPQASPTPKGAGVPEHGP